MTLGLKHETRIRCQPADDPLARDDAKAITELTEGTGGCFSFGIAAAAAAWAAATASCCSMDLTFKKVIKSAVEMVTKSYIFVIDTCKGLLPANDSKPSLIF
jgi:hypothetical protein